MWFGRSSESSDGRGFLKGSRDRRSFLRFFGGGLALAVPAMYSLTSVATATAACADTCEEVYVVYVGHSCGRWAGTCPAGNSRTCYGTYEYRCTCSGIVCWTEIDNEGPCAGD
jgi:hypothetical protein